MDAAPLAHARRNWLAHASEGGLWMGALALINAQTLLPSVVQGLHGPEWLVTLMPVMMMVGFQLPPLFIAHHIGRLHRFLPLLLWACVGQRLPFLVAGLVLLYTDRPGPALLAVALAPLISGLFSGLGITAWQQLIVRTVPAGRRSSLFASRLLIAGLIGIGAGHLVESTLRAHPGMPGYGRLHLWAFACMAGSYLALALVREPRAVREREPETGLWTNLRSMPGQVAADARLRLFLITTGLFSLSGLFVPYLAIHARHRTGLPESFLGELVAWQMAGAIAGSLFAGWSGDRWGGKTALVAARACLLAVCVLALLGGSSTWLWDAAFLLFGAAFNANMIGTGVMQLEILPARGQANVLALITFSQLPAALLAALVGAALWQHLGDGAFPWLVGGSIAGLLLSLLGALRLVEPRAERRP